METVTRIAPTKQPLHPIVDGLAVYQLQAEQEVIDDVELTEHRQYLVSHIDDFGDCV